MSQNIFSSRPNAGFNTFCLHIIAFYFFGLFSSLCLLQLTKADTPSITQQFLSKASPLCEDSLEHNSSSNGTEKHEAVDVTFGVSCTGQMYIGPLYTENYPFRCLCSSHFRSIAYITFSFHLQCSACIAHIITRGGIHLPFLHRMMSQS